MSETKRTNVNITKVDASLGLVLGWTIITKVDGEPYFDLQGDHIPDDVMLKASTDFMENRRTAKAMHAGVERGAILHSFPMTEEIAKSYGIDTGGKYGLMVAAKFDAEILAKFTSGEYTGFSIGGFASNIEEVEDDE